MVSTGHVGGTCGSGIVSIAADMLRMRVVCGARGVGRVCEMCICFARGGAGGERGGERMRELGLGFTNLVGTGGCFSVWVAVV